MRSDRQVVLVISFILGTSIFAGGEHAADRTRPVVDLVAILDRASRRVVSDRMPAFAEMAYMQSILSDWSIPEIDAVMDDWTSREEDHGWLHYWNEAFTERYAFLDEKPMCEGLLAMNGELARLAEEAGKGLEGNSAESLLSSYYDNLAAIIRGWSRRDPKAAWAAVKGKGGLLFDSPLIAGYGYLLPRTIFEHLARVDPQMARAEFLAYGEVPHEGAGSGGLAPGVSNVLYQGSMLRGMARGLPKGYDWQKLIEEALTIPRAHNWEIVHPLRGRILARWMQDDARAAVAWFRSEAAEAISMEEVEVYSDKGVEIGREKKPVSLRFALRHWLGNDWRGAVRWLRNHPELVGEVLEEEAWFDQDRLTQADLRRLLVEVQPITVREDFLLDLAKTGKLDLLLSRISSGPESPTEKDWEETKREISELKVGDEIEKRLLELWRQDPPDDDPFGN